MQWEITPGLTPYEDALARMQSHVAAMRAGQAGELVWLVEHPPLYTLGTSAKASDVLIPSPYRGGDGRGADANTSASQSPPSSFAKATEDRPNLPPAGGGIQHMPTYQTGRGGQVTYHGPGQRVVYLMLDLKKRAAANGTAPDLRAYVQKLEAWIILTLAEFGVAGFTREGRVGVWVEEGVVRGAWRVAKLTEARSADLASHEPPKARAGLGSMPMSAANNEAKIAALGVRVQGWVTSHGIAINVHPDLSHYAGIVPCGIREFGVTSLAALGVHTTMDVVDAALARSFAQLFPESIA